MLIPFSGASRHGEHNLTYNFYLKLNRYDCNNYKDLGDEPLNDGPQGNRGYLPVISRTRNSSIQNNSFRRTNIVNMIKERDVVRPLHNIEQNG